MGAIGYYKVYSYGLSFECCMKNIENSESP